MIPNISRYEAEKLWNIADLPPKHRLKTLNKLLKQVRQADREIDKHGNKKF